MREDDPLRNVSLNLVESFQDVQDFFTWLSERRPVLGCDTETTGLAWWTPHFLRMVQFGDAHTGWAIPWHLWAGVAVEALEKYKGRIVAHNAPFDAHTLSRAGCRIRRHLWDDTKVMHHLLDPPASHALKSVSTSLISPRAAAGERLLKEGMAKNNWDWATVPHTFEPYWLYSALDPVLAARMFETMESDVLNTELYDLELSAQWAMVDAEERGMRVDVEYADATRKALLDVFYELGDKGKDEWGVHLGSTAQVTERLIADGVPLIKKTKTGNWSLDKEVLSGLEGKHPLADMVIAYKRSYKFATSYFQAVLNRLDGDIVHASINTLGARTGRMSVSNPPLQQLPSNDKQVRRMFIPRPGHAFLSVDQSNIEVRLLAHFSQEPTMLDAFRRGEDIHMAMARAMYGPDATEAHRKKSKSGTLGRQYGIGVRKFAVQQGMTEDASRSFLNFYDETFPGVPDFIRHVEDTARERYRSENVAYITTPAGRRQTLRPQEAADGAFYKLVNYLCQGHAADILKLSIARLYQAGLAEHLVMPVHDELLWDAPKEDVLDLRHEVQEVMDDMDGYSVPITTDAEVYLESWADSVKYREPVDLFRILNEQEESFV